ncbi:MAG: alpha/beta hydrolase [Gammaproteobacteria bacterium]|nr:MAG: alpha/beta hydrolase [Gammaproteobacteria bacterium]
MTRATSRVMALSFAVLLTGCAIGSGLPEGATVLENQPHSEAEDALGGDLYLPAGNDRRPAVLLIHGGGWRNGNPGQMAHLGRSLAGEGFVAYSAAYRFAPEHTHPAQVEDVRQAMAWLARHERVDPDRIAIWGYSAGAHLALMLGFGAEPDAADNGRPRRPAAVVAGGSPTDFERFEPNGRLLVNLVGAPRKDDPDGWRRASPIHWADGDSPPIYLYHGRLDRVVDIGHSEVLYTALTDLGVPVEFDEVGWGHFWVFLVNRGVERRATAFLHSILASGGRLE